MTLSMNNSFGKTCTIAALALMGASCASSRAMPQSLAEARRDYEHTLASDARALAPVELHAANLALHKANEAYRLDPGASEIDHLAYVAQRRSATARVQARVAQANQRAELSAAAARDGEAKALVETRNELARARQELSNSKVAMEKLKDIKGGQVTEDERGVVITLSGSVLFEHGKATLLPAARAQLAELAQALKRAKADSMTIEGFTDATGADKVNAVVSQARAEAVLGYLSSRGISATNMRAVGRGAKNPIASNQTREGRATNRRVEIVVHAEAAAQR